MSDTLTKREKRTAAFKVKNERRKAARERAKQQGWRPDQIIEARWGRRHRTVNGEFGDVKPGKWNELVIGTLGDERELEKDEVDA